MSLSSFVIVLLIVYIASAMFWTSFVEPESRWGRLTAFIPVINTVMSVVAVVVGIIFYIKDGR